MSTFGQDASLSKICLLFTEVAVRVGMRLHHGGRILQTRTVLHLGLVRVFELACRLRVDCIYAECV